MKRASGPQAAWEQRLTAVADRWSLPPGALPRLAQLLTAVRDDPRAATSVRAPERAVDVHVADSLAALPLLDRAVTAGRVADIGSGAGFPGLPLAIARPDLGVDLVESIARKCAFLEDAIRAADVPNAAVVSARAEDWARVAGRERYGAVTARAVAPLATLAEYAAPLLEAGGALIAWKGERDPREERAGAAAAETVGLRPVAVEPVRPYPGSRAHHLHLYEKMRPTPPEFPRRTGVAAKRPLG